MIRVDRTRLAPPPELDGATSSGGRELSDVLKFYRDKANRGKPYDKFKAYKSEGVVKALRELFCGKCAYCESPYIGTQPPDIEHFRPKGGVAVLDRKTGKPVLRTPGYYWLAARWENLLPSCVDCNRVRTQDFEGQDPITSGKANKFPLEKGSRYATRPGGEKKERPLLLNPCEEDPEKHLEFTEEGAVRAALDGPNGPSLKGTVSIEVYGLRRAGLSQLRRDRATLVLAQIRRVKEAEKRFAENRTSPSRRDELVREMEDLRWYMENHQPYAGMARQLVNAFYRPG